MLIRPLRKYKVEDFYKMVELYELGWSSPKLAKHYNTSVSFVFRMLQRYGAKTRTFTDINKKYEIDETIFEKIDCEWKAYFLGLLFSDGNVYHNTVCISLQQSDKNLLLKLKEILFGNQPKELYVRNTGNPNHQLQYKLSIHSKKIADDLRKLGCISKKSLTLKWPDEGVIPKNLMHHFIRGIFDGDGTIGLYGKTPKFSIAGTLNISEGIAKVLSEELKIRVNVGPTSTIFNCYIGSKFSIKMVGEWLYKDATIFMERKWIKFQEIKKTIYWNSSRTGYKNLPPQQEELEIK